VLPKSQDSPPLIFEDGVGLFVALLVSLNLRSPPVGIGPRLPEVLWASVPEAAVDEDCNPSAPKNDVGAPPKSRDRSSIDSVSEPAFVQQTADGDFALRVTPFLCGHPRTNR